MESQLYQRAMREENKNSQVQGCSDEKHPQPERESYAGHQNPKGDQCCRGTPETIQLGNNKQHFEVLAGGKATIHGPHSKTIWRSVMSNLPSFRRGHPESAANNRQECRCVSEGEKKHHIPQRRTFSRCFQNNISYNCYY